MRITRDLIYIGVNDKSSGLFEGQYVTPNGMAYNSYVISDEKIAVFDTACAECREKWLSNLHKVLNGKSPSYLIIHHMEPDHSSCIDSLLKEFPSIQIVATARAFSMINQFFGCNYSNNQIPVKNGDSLSLGKHTLTFYEAPMVHWPEVMVSYDSYDKTLFSADAFGKFGTADIDEKWAHEARRYYFGIVGKYGAQAGALIKKISALEINIICPLHGPVLSENLDYYINLYKIWTSYEAEEKGTFIAYNSVYGNTKKAVTALEKELLALGDTVCTIDLTRCDMSKAVENAFRYSRLVLAGTTYNSDLFPHMKAFLNELTERNYQKRTVAIIENGSWSPLAARKIKEKLEKSKEIVFCENTVTILSAPNDKTMQEVKALANELVNK